MAILLGLCLRLLANNRNSDSVHRCVVSHADFLTRFDKMRSRLGNSFEYVYVCSTAVATVRQAVALIFDSALKGEGLPVLHYGGTGGWSSTSNSLAGEVSRNISTSG